jgi:hypothetical protein
VPPNLDAATAADAPPQSKRLGVIYSIAASAVRAPLLWIGTDDGYIHVTQDDGKTWTNVTPRELTAWSKVVMLEASHFDANEAYAAIDRHRLEDNEPYVYRTKDGGKTWQKITNGLPAGVYMQTIKEDPKRADCWWRERSWACSCRSTTATVAVAAAQPAALLDARPRVPRQRLIGRRTAAGSGCSTTSARCGRHQLTSCRRCVSVRRPTRS